MTEKGVRINFPNDEQIQKHMDGDKHAPGMFFEGCDQMSLGWDTWFAAVSPWLEHQKEPIRVLEIGSGKFSTTYFGNHPLVSSVTSLEAQDGWYETVHGLVKDNQKVRLIQCMHEGKPSGPKNGETDDLKKLVDAGERWDLALVDGMDVTRMPCLDYLLKNDAVRVAVVHDFMDALSYSNHPAYYNPHGRVIIRVKWVWPTSAMFVYREDFNEVAHALYHGSGRILKRLHEWALASGGCLMPDQQLFETVIPSLINHPMNSVYLWSEVPLYELMKRQAETARVDNQGD